MKVPERVVGSLVLLLLAGSLAAAASEAVLVVSGSRGKGSAVVTAPVDLAEVATATGALKAPDPAALRATVVESGRTRQLPCQFQPSGEPGKPPTAGKISVLLPEGVKAGRVRLTWDKNLPLAKTRAQVSVERRGNAVTVRNEYYAVTHDPKKMGGLPCRIEFVQSGKVFDSFTLNDRVFSKELGGFLLRDDPAPEVTVLAEGPVYAAVRVKARYFQGDRQPAPRPEAVYEFRYYAGSPLVSVEAHVTQQTPFAWREHHFLEINFPDRSFTGWAGGEPLKSGVFSATEKGWSAGQWGALVEGHDVLGLLGCGSVKFYDGRGGYGTYLHGPWVRWSTTRQDFHALLWIGASPAGAAAVQRAAREGSAVLKAYVTVPSFEKLVDKVRRQCATLSPTAAGRAAWTLAQVTGEAYRRGKLAEGLILARQLSGLVGGGKKADPVAWFCARKRTWQPFSTDELLAVFDTDRLKLVSLYDLSARRELLTSAPPPLWELTLQRADHTERLTADSPTLKRTFRVSKTTPARLTLDWRSTGEPGPVEVACHARLERGALLLTLTVDNASSVWSVRGITFPQVEFGVLGDSETDDFVATARASGELRKAPLASSYHFSGLYPSGASTMQFAAYYDPRGGIYFAAEDPVASTKDIQVESVSGHPGLAMRVHWPAPDATIPGNDWEMPGPAALRLVRGDWFDAAQLYKAWAREHARWWPPDESRPDTPDWFKDIAMWACTGGAPKECVDKVKALAKYVGAPTAFHWYNWHQIPFDVHYPDYFPPKQGVPAAVNELQRAGVRVMPYINGRLWDTANEDFKQEGRKYCTKDEQGNPYIEVYGSGAKLSPMCPFTPFWQHTLQRIVRRLTGPEVGVDAVYLDQIAAARPRLCYGRTHGHPLGGGHWWTSQGYWPLLKEMRRQLREHTPGKALTSECNAESYTRYLDGLLTWHFQYQDQIPLFAAVYGGRIQLFSRAYRGNDQTAHRMKAGQSLVFGEQIGWLNPDLVLKHPVTGDFIRRMAQLRYRLRAFLARGEMARPPMIVGDVPSVTADWAWSGKWPVTTSALQSAAWRATDGRLAVLFVNVSDKPVRAVWRFRPADYDLPPQTRCLVVELVAARSQPEGGSFTRTLTLPPRGTQVFVVKPER